MLLQTLLPKPWIRNIYSLGSHRFDFYTHVSLEASLKHGEFNGPVFSVNVGKPSNENGPLSGKCCDDHGHSESRESKPSQERHKEPETANQHHVDVNHHCGRNIKVYSHVRAFSLVMMKVKLTGILFKVFLEFMVLVILVGDMSSTS